MTGVKTGGKEPKVTPELVQSVAGLVAIGTPLRYACAVQTPQITAGHFQKALDKLPALLALYDKILGQWIINAMQQINSATCRTLPGVCWTLERTMREHYSANGKGNSTGTTINVCIGLSDDIAKRAAQLVLNHGKPRPGSKVIDVSSEVKQIENKAS